MNVECSVCHTQHVLKIQGDYMMNRGDVPIRVGCRNCGIVIQGSIGRSGLSLKNAVAVKPEGTPIFQNLLTIAISSELPICKECYFPERFLVNNIMILPQHLPDTVIHTHSRKMAVVSDGMTEMFDHLKILHDLKQHGNTKVFDEYTKEHFNRDEKDITDTPDKMRVGFINLYNQLSFYVRTEAYKNAFILPYIDKYGKLVEALSEQQKQDLNNAITPYMVLHNDVDEAIKVLLAFWNKRACFYPVMLLLGVNDFKKEYGGELFLSTTDFEDIKGLYAEMFELLSRFSMYMVAIENIQQRGNFDLLATNKPLSDYCRLTNGNKHDYIETHSSLKDYYVRTLDNKIRNGIDHAKTKYDAKTQVITYYPNIKDPNVSLDIALIDFAFIVLQQAVKLSESLCVVCSFL